MLGVTNFTLTEKLQQQKRFFCENCKQEVFLQENYCSKCGGEIDWPKEIKTLVASWSPKGKKRK